MLKFKDYLNESNFKLASRFEQVQAALDHTDNRSRKNYIDRLNKMTHDQINDVENAIEHETGKYINAEYAKNKTWDEKKELDIAVDVDLWWFEIEPRPSYALGEVDEVLLMDEEERFHKGL